VNFAKKSWVVFNWREQSSNGCRPEDKHKDWVYGFSSLAASGWKNLQFMQWKKSVFCL
jgi:hypothetical protein